MIHFCNLQKTVGDRTLFQDLTLFLPKASYTLLCGERKSGKTTLVNMLLAFVKPDSGTLTVDGIDIGSIPEARIPYLRRQIGLVADTPALLEERSVIENISVPLQLAGLEQNDIDERLNAMLESTGLRDDAKTRVNRLTAATRQRVSVARAVIHKPPVVVADEPLHNLDDETAGVVVDQLNNANHSGATVLIMCQADNQLSRLVATQAKTLEINAGSIGQDENNNTGRDNIA